MQEENNYKELRNIDFILINSKDNHFSADTIFAMIIDGDKFNVFKTKFNRRNKTYSPTSLIGYFENIEFNEFKRLNEIETLNEYKTFYFSFISMEETDDYKKTCSFICYNTVIKIDNNFL